MKLLIMGVDKEDTKTISELELFARDEGDRPLIERIISRINAFFRQLAAFFRTLFSGGSGSPLS